MILRGQVQEERDHLNNEHSTLKQQQLDIQKERKETAREKERLEALQTELEMRASQINEAAKVNTVTSYNTLATYNTLTSYNTNII